MFFRKKITEAILKPFTMTSYFGLVPYETDYENWMKEAYKNPFFNAALREIITDFNSCKISVYKKKRDGSLEEQVNHRVLKMLESPNDELTQDQFQEYFLTWYLCGGANLLYKTKAPMNKSIFIYSPNSFNVQRNSNDLRINAISVGETTIQGLDLKNYHVVKGINAVDDAIAGRSEKFTSQFDSLAKVIDMTNYAIDHQIRQMKNSGKRTGILKYFGFKSEAQKMEAKQQFEKFSKGSDTGNVALVPGDKYEFTPLDITPQEMDWLNSVQYMQEVICSTMGVPVQLLSSKNGTYNNVKEMKKKIYNDTIVPLLKMYCDQMSLFLKDELDGAFIWYDVSQIAELQPDILDITEKLSKALDGKVTLNQFYRILQQKTGIEIEPLSSDLGDKIITDQSKIFLNDLNFDVPVPSGEVVE